MKKKPMTVGIPGDTYDLLRDAAKARNMSLAKVIGRLVEDTALDNPDVVPVVFQIPKRVVEAGPDVVRAWLAPRVEQVARQVSGPAA